MWQCCNFQSADMRGCSESGCRVAGEQSDHSVDELILTPHIRSAHPSNLPLAQPVDRFITQNRSSRLELSESLLGIHSSFNSAVVLLDDVVQVLYGPVTAATP
jgi:hypothetical protein